MKKKKISLALLVASSLITLAGCAKEETGNNDFQPVELLSCGSTSVDKVITNLSSKFADLTGNKVTLKKDQHGSGDAASGVTSGKNNVKYDIGFLSREIKDSEKTLLSESNKNGKMCKDAVVPIVNASNNYAQTDAKTLVSIYKGEKKNWNEVDASLNGDTIHLYSREAGSGTRECFFEGIGYSDVKAEDKWLDGVTVSSLASNGDMMKGVADDKYAIGYCSLDSLSSASGIKGLTYEGVVASESTVNDGTYKLSRNFNYVIRGDYQEGSTRAMALNAFVDFMSTKEGLAAIKAAGGIVSDLASAKSWSEIQTAKYPLLAA